MKSKQFSQLGFHGSTASHIYNSFCHNNIQPYLLLIFVSVCLFGALSFKAAHASTTVEIARANLTEVDAVQSAQPPTLFEPLQRRSVDESGQQPAALRTRYININFDTLGGPSGPLSADAGPGQQFMLPLFDDVTHIAELDRIQRNPSGSYTWIGHLADDPLSLVILVVNGEMMFGSVSTSQGNFDIRHVPDEEIPTLHTLNHVDDRFYMQNGQDTITKESNSETQQEFRLLPRGARAIREGGFNHPPDDGSIIDVMVVYTDDFTRLPYVNTKSGAHTLIELYVAYTNEVMARSGVRTRLALVHTQEVQFEESADSGFTGLNHDLNALETGTKGLDIVHTLRNTYHADQVTMLVSRGSGGLAFIPDEVNNEESLAVAILGCLSPCQHLYAHEVGHNFGATHDWFNTGVDAKLAPYAHGHVDAVNNFRTVMAYNNVCEALNAGSCPQIPYYSNPNLTYNGVPMGIPAGTDSTCPKGDQFHYLCDSDVARIINETTVRTAGYRSSKIVWTGAVDQDWNNPNNWDMYDGPLNSDVSKQLIHRTPRSIDDVHIPTNPAGGRFPIVSGDGELRNLMLEEDAQLTLTGGILSVHGHWEDYGRVNANGGTVVFKSYLRQTIRCNSGSSFYNLQIGDNTTQLVELESDLKVDGDMTFGAGASFKPHSYTLRVSGDWIELGSSFDPQTSTVILNGTNQTLQKATSSLLLDEQFEEYDILDAGSNVTNPPQSWLVTNETLNGKQWEFTPRQWAPNTSLNGHARRWQNSTTGRPIDTWLFTPGLELYPGYEYQATFDYGSLRNNCPGDNLYVALGQEQSAAAMTTSLNRYTTIRNTVWQTTSPIRFTVPFQGFYHLGFQNYNDDGAWPCSVALDNIQIRTTGDHFFYNLIIESDGTQGTRATDADIHVYNNLAVQSDSLLDMGQNQLFVDGYVTNQGALQQSIDIKSGSSVPYNFLTITGSPVSNNVGTNQYYGVQITPDGGTALGLTTVRILGEQDCSITTDPRPVLGRCFEITTENSGASATLRLWYTEAERNDQNSLNLELWRISSTRWRSLGTDGRYGSDRESCPSDDVCWFEWRGVTQFGTLAGGSPYSDVTIEVDISPEIVAPGDVVEHTFTYQNLGPDVATDVRIVYTPPYNILSFESPNSSTNGGITMISYSWNLGDLEPNESGAVQAAVILNTEVPEDIVFGVANISASNDARTDNNESTTEFVLIKPTSAPPTATPTPRPTATPIPTATPTIAENATVPAIPMSNGELSFEYSYYKIDENMGEATITVLLDPVNLDSETTVHYRVGDKLATGSEDFAPTSGILRFPPGTAQASFVIPILDDNVIEPNKLFDIFLEEPIGAELGSVSDAIINIIDNDYVDLMIEQKIAPVIVQPSKVVIYTVDFANLGNAVAEDITIVNQVTSSLSELSYRTNSPVPVRLVPSDIPYVWQIDRLNPNQSGQIIIAGRLNTLSPGTRIHNTVTITGTHDKTPENNLDDDASFTVLNIAPLAANDTITTTEDTAVRIPVLMNDSDGNGERLQISSVTNAAHGTVIIDGSTLMYTPDANYFGQDTFEYTTSDNALRSSATVEVTVYAIDDPPAARTDIVTMDEDMQLAIPVLNNDIELDGDLLYLDSITAGRNGKASIDGDNVIYEPLADFNGTVVMTYTVMDSETPDGLSSLGTISLTIRPVNDPPYAEGDAITTTQDTMVTIPVLENDYDVDGDPLLLYLLEEGNPKYGTITLNDTAIIYEPQPGFVGQDTFSYKITDSPEPDALSATATVEIDVQPIDQQNTATPDMDSASIVVADVVTTTEDSAIIIDVLQNDLAGLSILALSAATHGTAEVIEGKVRYQPSPDFNGMDSFTYSVMSTEMSTGTEPITAPVRITVLPVNDAPSFSKGRDQVVVRDSEVHTIPGWATDISPGAANEQAQQLSFVMQASHPQFFSEQPTVDPTSGDLSYQLTESARGIVFISATLADDGGTENGGSDQSKIARFTLTVLQPANDSLSAQRTIYDPLELFDPDGPEPTVITAEFEAEIALMVESESAATAAGDVASFVIDYENNSAESLEGTVVTAIVPESSTFRSTDSGINPSNNPQTRRDDVPEGGPIVEQFWELPDGSGPCPDGHPAGEMCIFRVDALSQGESGSLRFNVVADDNLESDTTLILDVGLRAADLANHRLIDLSDSTVQATTNSINDVYLPVIVK